MASSETKWMGPSLATVAALGLTVAGLMIVGVGHRNDLPLAATTAAASTSSGPIDATTEIRVRALADAATLGVSGLGCEGLLRGSGFVVGDLSYTNRHLVEGGASVKFDQAVEPVVQPVVAIGADLDVATAEAVEVISLEFADRNPALGATVFLAGHAGGFGTQVVEGSVHLYGDGATWGVDGDVMLIDAITEPGFSGGPVLDTDGRVVAMLQGYEPTIGLTLAIAVEDLRTWVAVGQEASPDRCQR